MISRYSSEVKDLTLANDRQELLGRTTGSLLQQLRPVHSIFIRFELSVKIFRFSLSLQFHIHLAKSRYLGHADVRFPSEFEFRDLFRSAGVVSEN